MPLAVAGLLRRYVDCTPAGQLVQAGAQYAGGELFDRVRAAGHFTEDEARYFFQQLICGVDYCHRKHVTHRDLKLVPSRSIFVCPPYSRVCFALHDLACAPNRLYTQFGTLRRFCAKLAHARCRGAAWPELTAAALLCAGEHFAGWLCGAVAQNRGLRLLQRYVRAHATQVHCGDASVH